MSFEAARHSSFAREALSNPADESNSSEASSKPDVIFDAESRIGILHALTAEQPSGFQRVRDSRRTATAPPRVQDRPETGPPPPLISHSSTLPAPDHYNEASINADLQSAYRKVRRELRMLFIYPASYLLTWTVPFISHCFQYSDYYARHPPFAITCISTAMTVLQCAIDCTIFTLREKVHLPHHSLLASPYHR